MMKEVERESAAADDAAEAGLQRQGFEDAQKEAKYAWYKDRSQPFLEIPMPMITLPEAMVHCIPFKDRVERDFYDVFQDKFLQETFESKAEASRRVLGEQQRWLTRVKAARACDFTMHRVQFSKDVEVPAQAPMICDSSLVALTDENSGLTD